MAVATITLLSTGQVAKAELDIVKEEKENPKVIDGYWINSKGEKITIRPFEDTTLYFYFITNTDAIGNSISFNIIDANVISYKESIIYHSFFEIKSIENKVSINIYDIFKDSLYTKKREYGLNFSLYVELSIHNKKQTFPKYAKEFLKIYILEFIPKVMEKQNPRWEIAAKCQKIWFNRDKAQKPNYTKIVTNVVTMNWIRKFPRVLPILNGIRNKMWETPRSINLFCQRLKEMVQNKDLELPKSIEIKKFGSFDNSKYRIDNDGYETTLLDRYYINEKVYSTDLINDPLDDLYGALGDFTFKITPKGIIETINTKGIYKVTYQKIAVYFIDSFDFVDNEFDIFSPRTYKSQPLGCWDFIDNKVSKNMFSDGLYIDNKSYQKYQNDTGKGGDFRLISDYEEIDVNFSFNVKMDTLTGSFNKI